MNRLFGKQLILFGALVALLWGKLTADEAAKANFQRFARSEMHMGVEFEVVLYCDQAAAADEGLTKAMARIAALDKTLSDYDPESELSRLSETSSAGDS